MSDAQGFLARWSRRKLEKLETASDSGAPKPGTPGTDGGPEPNASAPQSPHAEAAVPAVDLSKLPSLESITASTDIRAFLAAGVPEQLKRAALSRAWTADPAIRDFVGLAENAWDFTAPDSMPGFGPMLPTDDIARMVAQITGKEESAGPAEGAAPRATPGDSAHELGAGAGATNESAQPATRTDRENDQPSPLAATATSGAVPPDESKALDISAQNEPLPEPGAAGRGHGGAVPR